MLSRIPADQREKVHGQHTAGEAEPKGAAFPEFRDFCLTHRDAIVRLVRTRWTQACVPRRCVCLLPSFARVFSATGLPLALLKAADRRGPAAMVGGEPSLSTGA